MTIEYEIEPTPGLPGTLPPGETIVWQGSPDWRSFARSVFHTRLVAIWFVFVASLAFVAGGTGLSGALVTMAVAVLGLGVLYLLAKASARSTIYTLTNRRIVMRFGVALPKCVNLPLSRIGAADQRAIGDGHVDIVLRLNDRFPLGWLQMWPHVQPWKLAEPRPMLRAVPDTVVAIFAATVAAAQSAAKLPTPAALPATSAPADRMGVAA